MSCQDATPHSFPASPGTKTRRRFGNLLVSLGATGALGGTGLEAVGEAAVDVTQRAHTAAAGGLAALGLLTPVDCHRKSVIFQHAISISGLHQSRERVHLRVLAAG